MYSGGAIVLSSAAALSLEGVDATTSGPGEVGRISSLVGGVATPSLKAFLGLMMVRENGRLAALSPEPPLPPPHPPSRPIRRKLSRAIQVLRRSSPSVFGVESTEIFGSKEWGPAKESMGQATRKVLPTDQVIFCARLTRFRHSAQSCPSPGT